MEVGKNFKDILSYNQNMAKSLEDKLFFLNNLPEDNYIFVDFGCADGVLTATLCDTVIGNNLFIGFDISEQMISLAKTKIIDSSNNIIFTSNWNDVINVMNGDNRKKVLILSSVIHEVYSYANNESDIDLFWNRVLESKFDYICVRDMMISSDISKTKTPSIWVNNLTLDAKNLVPNNRREQFIKIWGSLKNKRNALHYILKYRWQINWDREVHENYFPIDTEDFVMIFEDKYNLDYFVRFKLPFIEDKLKEDFHITLGPNDFTHIKAVFSLKSINDE